MGGSQTLLEVMIWGKTYPELSIRHTETVCTGGVSLKTGQPVRLYPVPLRYLDGDKKYRLYDTITVLGSKSTVDRRPESFKIDVDSITQTGNVPPDRFGWAERRRLLGMDPSWQYSSMPRLLADERRGLRSMAMLRPSELLGVTMSPKAKTDERKHHEKWDRITSQTDLFPREYKHLGYVPYTFKVEWRCSEPSTCHCGNRPHNMGVLDWGLIELGRREGWDKALSKLEAVADPSEKDFQLFLGNMKSHPRVFAIVGLWYPTLNEQIPLL